MSMLMQQNNYMEDMETLRNMYTWLRAGYKQVEQRLAKTIEENEHLKQIVKEKNLHPFID
jgi:hypothetical protein